ncbi:MAG: hypothetical protein M0R76_12525 [Proteobacteria bacterium]|nr:hypothetical protein [Pseudomonadota bacterium]
MRYRLIFLGLLLLLLGQGRIATAWHQQVASDLWLRGDSFAAADGSTIARRNIVEDLQLAAWHVVPGAAHNDAPGWQISLMANMRFLGDLGVDSAEVSPQREERYVPGLSASRVEALAAWLDMQGLARGALDLRIGRQFRLDATGFLALDGVDVALHLPRGWQVSAFLGMPVRADQRLGHVSPLLDGIDNGGREGLEAHQYRDRTDGETTIAWGAELSFSPRPWFAAALAVRLLGPASSLREAAVGAHFYAGNERVALRGELVTHPLLDRRDNWGAALREGTLVSSANAALGLSPFGDTWVWVGYDLFRPTFDADSIFNVFYYLPRRDLQLRVERGFGPAWQGTASGFLRFEDDAADMGGDEVTGRALAGAGVDLRLRHTAWQREQLVSWHWAKVWGETRAGIDVEGRRAFWGQRLWLGLRGVVYMLSDAMAREWRGFQVGAVASLRFRIAKLTYLMGEVENFYGRGSAAYLAGMVWLRWELWR